MSHVSHGGRHTDEFITGSRRELAMWAMWPDVGPEAHRHRCCLQRLGFGTHATRGPALSASLSLIAVEAKEIALIRRSRGTQHLRFDRLVRP